MKYSGPINFVLNNWIRHVKQRRHDLDIPSFMHELDSTLGTQLCDLDTIQDTDIEYTQDHEVLIDTICEMYPWARDTWIDFLGDYEDVVIEKQGGYWVVVGTNFIVESPRHRVIIGKCVDGKYVPLEDEDVSILENKDMAYTMGFVKSFILQDTTSFDFYKNSLRLADKEIKLEKPGKAMKDIIGRAYESHRRRVWEYFGFRISKQRAAQFNVDWVIFFNNKLVALEEDKGHYMDSCFLDRAINGFAKTVHMYQNKNMKIPKLIIHSFCRYNKFHEKKNEDLNTRAGKIRKELYNNLVYTTLVSRDRFPKHKWFGKCDNCYSIYAEDELIMKDIAFIHSLKRFRH